MKLSGKIFFLLLVLLLNATLANGATMDLYAITDTWIEDNSETNHGSDTTLQVREQSAVDRRYSLVKWDLSSWAGATINSVEMWFYTTSATETLYPSVYKITSDWDENAATYTMRTATESWTTAGVDYNSVAVANLGWNIFVNQYKNVIEGGTNPDFTALVQNWVDNPSVNYGILVRRPYDTGAREGSFASREYQSPYLRISYDTAASPNSMEIVFDSVPGSSDVEKLNNLPALIQSRLVTIGTLYSSLDNNDIELDSLNTTVNVLFSGRVHDFLSLAQPVDMGHCFAFVGDGRPIFECGSNGFIKFSQRKTLIEDIIFAGPRGSTPPIIIYSNSASDPNSEPNALGLSARSGDVRISRCYFKGFGIALRTQPGQETDSTYIRISDSTFYNCLQLSDYLNANWCVIENSWFTPTFESNKAFIVNHGGLLLRDLVAVPQSDTGILSNMRWIDNHGSILDIRNSRFGNETVNKGDVIYGEQVSLVYNYTKYATTKTTGSIEQHVDRNRVVIEDNILYARNVPVVKFFEIPNHVVIKSNTGLTGKVVYLGQEYDTSYLCAFDPNLVMPDPNTAPYILFNIRDNNRALKITEQDPAYLPVPLRYFGPRQRGVE